MFNLHDVLPEDTPMENYCHPENFRLWEENIAGPALIALGYHDLRWSTGERDSWGPLSRVVTAYDANGEVVKFVYG